MLLEKRNMEARLAKLSNVVLENSTKKDLVGGNNEVKFERYIFISCIFYLFFILFLNLCLI